MVLEGADADGDETGLVAAEVAEAEPALLVAFTTTSRESPTSDDWTV
jgi:alkaline phosphatase